MKTLKNRFVHLLPAFPPEKFNTEQAEEFIGDVIDSYIKSAKFLTKEINNIIRAYGLPNQGIRDQDKISTIREFIKDLLIKVSDNNNSMKKEEYPPSEHKNEHNIYQCHTCKIWWSTDDDAWECCSEEWT